MGKGETAIGGDDMDGEKLTMATGGDVGPGTTGVEVLVVAARGR